MRALSPFDQTVLDIFDAMPEPVWLAHPDGRIAYVSPSGLNLLGLSRDSIYADGWQHITHPDDRERVFAAVARTLQTGEPYDVECRMRDAQGSYRWIRSRAAALRDGSDNIVAFVGHVIDIDRYVAAQAHAREAELAFAEARDFNDAIIDAMPIIFWRSDADGNLEYFSPWFYEFTGLERSPSGPVNVWETLHPTDRVGAEERWRAIRERGQAADRFVRYRRSDGAYRWHHIYSAPLRNALGDITGWLGFSVDVHDQRRAAERQTFLLRATDRLSPLLDTAELFARLTRECVPEMGDCAQLYVQRDGVLVRTETAGEQLDAFPELTSLEGVVARTTVVTPLYNASGAFGALVTAFGASDRTYEREDVATLQLLAQRVSVIVESAQRFAREHRVAEALQRASLPQELPSPAGMTLAAFYAAAAAESQIGGDWYDAVELRDGRVMLSIGDVAGHGLEAAVTMANMRQIVRGIAHVHPDPALMLEAADRALRTEHPAAYVTCFVGVIDPVESTLSYATAGHPPAMLRTSDGAVKLLAVPGLPLGLRKTIEPATVVVEIAEGDMLVLYTDGLTEVDHRPIAGEEQLIAAISEPKFSSCPDPARALFERLVTIEPRDDIAILVASVGKLQRPSSTLYRYSADSRDIDMMREVRAQTEREIEKTFSQEEDRFRVQLVLSEMIGNVVRHTPGTVEIVLERRREAFVVHTLDDGDGFEFVPKLPLDHYSERGRGLFLAASFADEFSVSRRPAGGSHARAVFARKN